MQSPGRAWAGGEGPVGGRAMHRPAPPPPTLFMPARSRAARGTSRSRAALQTSRTCRPNLGRATGHRWHWWCISTVNSDNKKKCYFFFNIGAMVFEIRVGRSSGSRKCIFRRVQGAGGARRGGVHVMMDIVLISICPLLPYCGGAGCDIDRCTGLSLTPRFHRTSFISLSAEDGSVKFTSDSAMHASLCICDAIWIIAGSGNLIGVLV